MAEAIEFSVPCILRWCETRRAVPDRGMPLSQRTSVPSDRLAGGSWPSSDDAAESRAGTHRHESRGLSIARREVRTIGKSSRPRRLGPLSQRAQGRADKLMSTSPGNRSQGRPHGGDVQPDLWSPRRAAASGQGAKTREGSRPAPMPDPQALWTRRRTNWLRGLTKKQIDEIINADARRSRRDRIAGSGTVSKARVGSQ